MEYLEMLIRIAKKAKGVKFMAFTKKYELINEYLDKNGKFPSNFKVLFSAWYDKIIFENPYNLPIAYIHDKKIDNPIPKKAIPCSGKCFKCFVCWNLKKKQAVVFEKH